MKNRQALIIFLLVIVLSSFGVQACNHGENGVEAARESTTPEERAFVLKAQQAHVSEVTLARLAQEHSQNGEVRDYADMIVNDHNNALEKLVGIMTDTKIPQAQHMVPETQKEVDRMRALSGIEFDREFVNMMVADHKKAVEMFRRSSTSFEKSAVQEYASENLPKLEKHLEEAQKLQSKLFNGGR